MAPQHRPDSLDRDIMNARAGNTLTVQVIAEEDKVPLASFLRVMGETLAMLREIDREMAEGGQGRLRWQISEVTYNSPLLMTIVGIPGNNSEFCAGVANEALDGLDRLEKGTEPSDHFPVAAMERAKNLAMLSQKGIASITLSAPDHQLVKPTSKLVANVDVILKRRFRFESTTLDGTLEAIDTHGVLKFYIYDVMTGQPIGCSFADELLEDAISALRDRIRVAVTGAAKYNRLGRPVSMKVESLRRLRPSSSLPKFREGEDAQMTRGIPSEDYVRRSRDAE